MWTQGHVDATLYRASRSQPLPACPGDTDSEVIRQGQILASIELEEGSREKSAFTTHRGLFEFVRMPFGLCNAPATFQCLMQRVLAGLECMGQSLSLCG